MDKAGRGPVSMELTFNGRRQTVSKETQETRKSHKGNGRCKGPGAGLCLESWRAERSPERLRGDEVRELEECGGRQMD